jgi:hypothetical protein
MELALATELYEKGNKGLEVTLTLDDLDVIVRLDFSRKYSLEIESSDTSDILYKVEEDTMILGEEDLTNAIKKMRSTLDELYYNKLLGKYVLKEDKEKVLIHKIFKKFLQVGDCSVCFEETSVATTCNHHCCHRCIVKTKVCPICEHSLYD